MDAEVRGAIPFMQLTVRVVDDGYTSGRRRVGILDQTLFGSAHSQSRWPMAQGRAEASGVPPELKVTSAVDAGHGLCATHGRWVQATNTSSRPGPHV